METATLIKPMPEPSTTAWQSRRHQRVPDTGAIATRVNRMIAQNIVYYREKAGLSQRALGRRFYLSHHQINQMEKGEINFQLWHLEKLAALFGIDWREFLKERSRDA